MTIAQITLIIMAAGLSSGVIVLILAKIEDNKRIKVIKEKKAASEAAHRIEKCKVRFFNRLKVRPHTTSQMLQWGGMKRKELDMLLQTEKASIKIASVKTKSGKKVKVISLK